MTIRTFESGDEDEVVKLWQDSGLVRPVNDPHKDIRCKLATQGPTRQELFPRTLRPFDTERERVPVRHGSTGSRTVPDSRNRQKPCREDDNTRPCTRQSDQERDDLQSGTWRHGFYGAAVRRVHATRHSRLRTNGGENPQVREDTEAMITPTAKISVVIGRVVHDGGSFHKQKRRSEENP